MSLDFPRLVICFALPETASTGTLDKEPWSDALEKDHRCRPAPLENIFPNS